VQRLQKNSNSYLTAYAYTPRSIWHAIEKGATGIEHESLFDEQTAKYMAERDIYLTLTPLEKGNPEYDAQSKTLNYNLNTASSFSIPIPRNFQI
jgi:imidazolonepropionase-like amidohydrolase